MPGSYPVLEPAPSRQLVYNGLLAGINNPYPMALYDQFGNPISTDRVGNTIALVTHNEDIDTDMVNLLLHEETGTTYTLAAPIAADDTEITVTDATGITVGMRFEITEGTAFQKSLPIVTDITGAPTIVLDGPFDEAYTTAAKVEVVVVNMAVVGSLAAPVSYIAKPHSDEIWHFTRLNFSMTHKTLGTDDKFGSLDPLTHGVVVRTHTALTGTKTIANWKANKDAIEDMYDVRYSTKAGGTSFGTAGRWSLKQRTDSIIRLVGASGDYAEVLIQDNLTLGAELTDFQMKLQGHVDEIAA